MKKAILAIAATLSFLIGCSFSKEKSNNHAPENHPASTSIEDKVKLLDAATLKNELNELTEPEFDELNTNASEIFRIALQRGSKEIALILIDAGLNPYKTDLNNSSIYNSPFVNDAHRFIVSDLFTLSKSQANTYIAADNFEGLQKKVNNFELPCDAVITEISEESDNEHLLNLLRNSPTCSQSVRTENLKNIFSDLFQKYIKSDFRNLEVLIELFKNIPGDSRLVALRSETGIKYYVHPSIVLQIIADLNPSATSNLATTLSGISKIGDPQIVYNWEENHKNHSEVVSRIGETLPPATRIQIETLVRNHYSRICLNDLSKPEGMSAARCGDFKALSKKSKNRSTQGENDNE